MPELTGARMNEPMKEIDMSDHIYKLTELVGSSPNSIEEAVSNAIARAAKTIRNMRWFEVIETRGVINEGTVSQWQVTVKIGFTLDE
jgi:dodecin